MGQLLHIMTQRQKFTTNETIVQRTQTHIRMAIAILCVPKGSGKGFFMNTNIVFQDIVRQPTPRIVARTTEHFISLYDQVGVSEVHFS